MWPKLIVTLLTGVCAAVGAMYPQYSAVATAVAGLLVGKEFLPQSAPKP